MEVNEDGTVGGSHRALVDLVRRIDRTRFQPVVLFYQDNPHVPTLRALGIEVLLFEEERARERRGQAQGRVSKLIHLGGAIASRVRFLRRHRIAIVHINNSPRVGYDDWLPATRIVGIPCVTFAMGDPIIRPALARLMTPRFDHVIAISEYMVAAMRKMGVPDERLSLVYLGVDPAQLRASVTGSRDAMRASLGVAADEVLVVMVGNIRRWKGQYVLLEALAQLPQDVLSRLRVRFVGAESSGDEEYRRTLDQRVSELRVGDRVAFLGARHDVPAIYAAADIAVHASVKAEPFGLVVPEAMSHGVAVVASKFGGPGEVLTPACGRTFDPEDPAELAAILTTLVRDPVLCRALGDAAREQVERFSLDAMVRGVERAYERVLTRT